MHTIGFIGLGRMGKNMILHLLENRVSVVGYNRTVQVTHDFSEEIKHTFFSPDENAVSFTAVETLGQMIEKLPTPRVIFLMVKAGQPVDQVISELLPLGLSKNDIVIDGGNSFYKDSVRRHNTLAQKSIHYIDCGTSGGLEGGRYGACLMLGGDRDVIESLKPVWDALSKKGKTSPPTFSGGRWDYIGASGAGHFVKAVHNGIEYGIDQAIGEGLAVLEKSPYALPLPTIVTNWTGGSVIRSWLLELLIRAFAKDTRLSSYSGHIGGGETGAWAKDAAHELGVPVPVLTAALKARQESQENPSFAGKVVSALRHEYGGHTEEVKEGGTT